MMAGGVGSDGLLAELAAEAAEVETVGPFLGAHRYQRFGRFAPIIGLGVLLIAANPNLSVTLRVMTTVGSPVILALAVVVPWQRLPRDAQGYLLLVPVVLILLLMTADEGLSSPYIWLEFLPLIWLVLYERLRILVAALVLVAAGLVMAFGLHPSREALPELLPVAILVLTFPRIHTLASNARRAMLAQAELANHDPLTGLLNRRGLSHLAKASTSTVDLEAAAIYVDVDHFKGLNDRLGHAAGDELLKQVGTRLVASVRTGDLVARVGGDEFVVIAQGGLETITRIQDRIASLTNTEPYQVGDALIAMTLSIGVRIGHRRHDLTALIEDADQAMLEAKADRQSQP